MLPPDPVTVQRHALSYNLPMLQTCNRVGPPSAGKSSPQQTFRFIALADIESRPNQTTTQRRVCARYLSKIMLSFTRRETPVHGRIWRIVCVLTEIDVGDEAYCRSWAKNRARSPSMRVMKRASGRARAPAATVHRPRRMSERLHAAANYLETKDETLALTTSVSLLSISLVMTPPLTSLSRSCCSLVRCWRN